MQSIIRKTQVQEPERFLPKQSLSIEMILWKILQKIFRMAIGKEVRLKYAYYVTCNKVIKNDDGEITELICEYDPESREEERPTNAKSKVPFNGSIDNRNKSGNSPV